jgi:hypothetical protein
MKAINQRIAVLMSCVFILAAVISCGTRSLGLDRHAADVQRSEFTNAPADLVGDLSWMVGEWICTKRGPERPAVGVPSDWFRQGLTLSVYRPYFDSLGVETRRRIAAEFTFVSVSGRKLVLDSLPVVVTTSNLVAGWPNGFGFQYKTNTVEARPQLVLSSHFVELTFVRSWNPPAPPLFPKVSLPFGGESNALLELDRFVKGNGVKR